MAGDFGTQSRKPLAVESRLAYRDWMSTDPEPAASPPPADAAAPAATPSTLPKEIGGSKKPEPTRYGDWEVGGICSDF
jgi:hypothetical protein